MYYILYCLSCFLEKILLSCVIFSVFRMLLFVFGEEEAAGHFGSPPEMGFS